MQLKNIAFKIFYLCPFTLFSPMIGMSLNVRRSSDPSMADLPPGEIMVGQAQPSRMNPNRWSTTAGFQKVNLKTNTSGGPSSLEQKVIFSCTFFSCKYIYKTFSYNTVNLIDNRYHLNNKSLILSMFMIRQLIITL